MVEGVLGWKVLGRERGDTDRELEEVVWRNVG